ncbi:MAG: RDD family protein [Saprospiraceae bacterium]|jgi:uncharacterized RDD family membrane protein YckC|nr:RDD family protein [Saprospiraceae bacterium]
MRAKIEITTAQHVVIEYQLATIGERILALFLDSFMFYLIILFLMIMIPSVIIYLVLPLFLLYHIFAEWMWGGQSVGKRILGLKVLSIDGSLPSFNQSMLRSIFYILDYFFTGGTLGLLLIGTTIRHQRLGDIAAGTTVIRMKSSDHMNLSAILSIDKSNYEVTYENVKNFDEQQIILIKETINKYKKYHSDTYKDLLIDLADLCSKKLGVERPRETIHFLNTIIRDYVMLTR